MSATEKLSALWKHLRGKGPAAAVAITLDLGAARDNKPFSIEAGGLIVESCTGDLYARINGPNGDGLNLRYVRRISYPFSSLFLTNTAQSGKAARLMLLPVGMKAEQLIGDVARLEYYDRSPSLPACNWDGYDAAHAWTQRWSYTVPNGRKALHQSLAMLSLPDIATSGCNSQVGIYYRFSAVDTWHLLAYIIQTYGSGYCASLTVAAPFVLFAGCQLRGMTYHNDSITHNYNLSSLVVEFDA